MAFYNPTIFTFVEVSDFFFCFFFDISLVGPPLSLDRGGWQKTPPSS